MSGKGGGEVIGDMNQATLFLFITKNFLIYNLYDVRHEYPITFRNEKFLSFQENNKNLYTFFMIPMNTRTYSPTYVLQ